MWVCILFSAQATAGPGGSRKVRSAWLPIGIKCGISPACCLPPVAELQQRLFLSVLECCGRLLWFGFVFMLTDCSLVYSVINLKTDFSMLSDTDLWLASSQLSYVGAL